MQHLLREVLHFYLERGERNEEKAVSGVSRLQPF
jgi:hypothetical protein